MEIDLTKKETNIIKLQEVDASLIPDGATKSSYPYLESGEDNKILVYMLGNYKVDGKYSLFIIEINYTTKMIKVLSESSPYHLVTLMGDSNSSPLISLPNKIYIRFS